MIPAQTTFNSFPMVVTIIVIVHIVVLAILFVPWRSRAWWVSIVSAVVGVGAAITLSTLSGNGSSDYVGSSSFVKVDYVPEAVESQWIKDRYGLTVEDRHIDRATGAVTFTAKDAEDRLTRYTLYYDKKQGIVSKGGKLYAPAHLYITGTPVSVKEASDS